MAIYDGMKRSALGSWGPDDSVLWVSTNGSGSGSGAWNRPFALPSQALAVVTADHNVVVCLPGEYQEEATITWPAVDGVLLTGFSHRGDAVTILGAEGEDVINIDPSAKTSTFDVTLADLTVDGGGSTCSGIRIDNGDIGSGIKLILFLNNVNISMDEDTEYAIEQVHKENKTSDFRMYCHGPNEYEGLMILEPEYQGDRYYFHGIKFPTGFQVGNTDCAARFEFRDCILTNDGSGGDNGHDTMIAGAVGCCSETSGTYAAFAKEDFASNVSTNLDVV